MLTEHEETGWTADRYLAYQSACRRASTSDVGLVPGLECNQDGFHVLCYGLRELPRRPSTATELAVAVHQQGCILCLAHPGKYHWTIDAGLLGTVDAVEIWNSKWIYDGALGPHPASVRLAAGKRVMVGQDVHKPKHLSSLFLDTQTDDVLADLRNGQYAFAFGPRRWTPQQLRCRTLTATAQRCRTTLMRTALTGRRLLRQIAG
ncbi:MAG: hypothetical protein EHM55_01630 [Acidobacteria bacterium]|nr:MAG: hypothetical protein EHM55_01630 [Acidobacteriota bacterium]